MVYRRIDDSGFMETVRQSDEETFSETARAAFDAEFDAERGNGRLAIALLLILAGALLGSLWYGVHSLAQMFGGA